MTDPAPPPVFKSAICKECLKPFDCEVIYVMRRGKQVAMQRTFWCGPYCCRVYNRRVRR
jgi:hypothetical protein